MSSEIEVVHDLSRRAKFSKRLLSRQNALELEESCNPTCEDNNNNNTNDDSIINNYNRSNSYGANVSHCGAKTGINDTHCRTEVNKLCALPVSSATPSLPVSSATPSLPVSSATPSLPFFTPAFSSPTPLLTTPLSDELLMKTPEKEAEDSRSFSKLHEYCKEGSLDMVKLRLDSGDNVNSTCDEEKTRNTTPLHLAVRKRHFLVAKQLLECGANVNISEETLTNRENKWLKSYTPLHWAVENADVNMTKLLLDYGASCNQPACLQDHKDITPLHLAAQDGNLAICRLLLQDPSCLRDPMKATPKRSLITPLHQAAFNGHRETVRLLLDMGCDPNKQADNGYSALHYACQIGDPEMVESILSHGGRHDLKSFTGVQMDITPLHLAVQSANESTIRLLAKWGADLEAQKNLGTLGGVTPLHQAVYQNKVKIVKLLLELGSNIHSRSGRTWYTPCHVAAEKGSLEILQLLLSSMDAKKNVNAKAELDEHADVTPLHVASQFGRKEVIRTLVKAGGDLTSTRRFGDRSGITCLHLAVEFGHADTVQLLIVLGSDVNAVDSLKYSALHTAVQNNQPYIIKTLLACNKCNLKLKSASGLTPKQLAKKSINSVELEALFRERNQSNDSRKVKARRAKSAVFKYLCGL